jgi:DNA-binding transcriptional LysR family regulator
MQIVASTNDMQPRNRAYSVELRQLRYFVAVGEEQHYGRAAQHLRVAQPALSRQIQNLEEKIGFKLFERLPRGVRITEAGKLFLDDSLRILREINDSIARAKRIASGQSGTLRIGFNQSMSFNGIVPDSLRLFRERVPDAELQPTPLTSAEQFAAVRSGSLDLGYVFTMGNIDRELAQLQVGAVKLLLAVPKGHQLTKSKRLPLRDLIDFPFIWFPRRTSPVFFDHLMDECARGGLKAPRIFRETTGETTILSLVACGVGVAFISSASRWQCPPSVTLLTVTDLNLRLPFALIWRKDNNSPLLAKFVADVKSMVGRQDRESQSDPNSANFHAS